MYQGTYPTCCSRAAECQRAADGLVGTHQLWSWGSGEQAAEQVSVSAQRPDPRTKQMVTEHSLFCARPSHHRVPGSMWGHSQMTTHPSVSPGWAFAILQEMAGSERLRNVIKDTQHTRGLNPGLLGHQRGESFQQSTCACVYCCECLGEPGSGYGCQSRLLPAQPCALSPTLTS